MTKTEIAIAQLQTIINTAQRRIDYLRSISTLLEQVGVVPTGSNNYVDFDFLSHDTVIEVIKVFPGKWNKKVNEDNETITYTREPVDGWTIRCYCGAPPPNCRIVEETITVPEAIVPAHTTIKRTLVCK